METVLMNPLPRYSLRSQHQDPSAGSTLSGKSMRCSHMKNAKTSSCATTAIVEALMRHSHNDISAAHPMSSSTANNANNSFCALPSMSSKSESDTETVDMPNAAQIIDKYSVDPYIFSHKELIGLSIAIFRHYELPVYFGFSESILSNFFYAVKDLYRTNNDFHNFHHAWGVMHMVFQILRNGADKFLDKFDIFAVLVAAICHDVGHPGNNNAFELAINSPVSKKYGEPNEICVLEKFHASETASLLSKKSRRTNSNLLVSLSEDAKERFVHQVRYIILGTDMAKHSSLVAEARDLVQRITEEHEKEEVRSCSDECKVESRKSDGSESADDALTTQESVSECNQLLRSRSSDEPSSCLLEKDVRLALTRIIVHCADIGAQTQDISIASKWAERVYREFRSQAEKERALGIVTTPFLHELQEDYMMYTSQAGFIGGIVMPIWTVMSQLCPRLQFAVNQLRDNQSHYTKVGDELKNKTQQLQNGADKKEAKPDCEECVAGQGSPRKRRKQHV